MGKIEEVIKNGARGQYSGQFLKRNAIAIK